MNKLYTSNILRSTFVHRNLKYCILANRTILSDAYLCENEWNKRLETQTLKDIKLDQYFVETDKKFGTKQLVSGVDVDLFANSVTNESQLDELEHLLYRFRRTKRCIEIMDSTVYAVVRFYLKHKNYETLFRILNDRENYGIFPDFYSYNILMSTFIKNKMFKESANIAVLMMLQENFENKLSCLLGLHSCQKFVEECTLDSLNAEAKDNSEEDSKNEEEDEEETLVRVPYIRNPWFDDHFEITNPKHLLGKTFYLIGRELKDSLGRSCQLVGLAMYEKWEKACNVLKSFLESTNASIYKDTIQIVQRHIEAIPEDEKNSRGHWLNEFNNLFKEMSSQKKVIDGTISEALTEALKDISQYEKQDIEAQKTLFLEWEKLRESALEKQNRELDKQRRLKVIEEKKEYLFWKEKLLFFFENEEENLKELKKVEELVSSLEEKTKEKDTYFPPEIIKKAPERLTKYQRLARVKKI